MRALVRGLLVAALPQTTDELGLPQSADIPAERWFGSGAVLDVPPRPFAEIRFGGRVRGMAQVNRRRLEVWIHDEEGDYDRIEKWIRYVKGVLDGAGHVGDGVGNEIISCEWLSDSTDLYDSGYRTNCMSTTFELVGKEV
jgi:hypothetical protein